jgi:hypothetical protein
MTNDPTIVVGVLARILERLSIPYVVGGAMASTLHGEPRTTLDVDVALQLEPSKALDLVRSKPTSSSSREASSRRPSYGLSATSSTATRS